MKKQKQTIETVAKILLANKISFNYETDFLKVDGKYQPYPIFLKVTDQTTRYNLFASASYHSKTKKLVLMCEDYTNSISFDTFLNYFIK